MFRLLMYSKTFIVYIFEKILNFYSSDSFSDLILAVSIVSNILLISDFVITVDDTDSHLQYFDILQYSGPECVHINTY